MSRATHRSARPFRTARAEMLARKGTVCVHCGHPGAGEADHIIPLALWPDQPVTWEGLQPSHGSNSRCYRCVSNKTGRPGRSCNQERGTGPAPTHRPALDW